MRSPSFAQWRRIGAKRRAGVLAPLFSVYSKESIGIGQFTDLVPLGEWARAAGLSIIQLLPLNEVGFGFCPYDSESSFALDPMYLNLTNLSGVSPGSFEKEIARLKTRFKIRPPSMDYRIKRAKLELLWKIFQKNPPSRDKTFQLYVETNAFWIRGYACYRVLKEHFNGRSWQEWPEEFRIRGQGAMSRLGKETAERVEFFQWLQWQSFNQLAEVKRRLRSRRVLLMGDLPFLVSRDSADVWTHPEYFKLDLAAGAPPDRMFAKGQKWGMPPYRWDKIGSDRYAYLIQKIRYAGNFYGLFRVDHFVGLFRVWTVPLHEQADKGVFDPPDETLWKKQGRQILSVILKNTEMLPCAEDLGTVPTCSPSVLKKFSVPGTEVQRWTKTDEGFRSPEDYRPNSMAVISTHDLSALCAWWQSECDTAERVLFWRALGLPGKPGRKCTPAFVEAALRHVNRSASVFSIQLLQDWLSLDQSKRMAFTRCRINIPGTVNDKNWTLLLPCSLEEIGRLGIHDKIRKIVSETNRDEGN